MECAGSVGLGLLIPKPPQSKAAKAGTDKHKLLEDAVEKKELKHSNPDVQKMLDWANARRAEGYLLLQECRIAVGSGIGLAEENALMGTADIICHGEAAPVKGHEIIFDAKFGRIPVKAKGNKQLLAYAAGHVGINDKFKGRRAEHVRLVIAQPQSEGFFDVADYTADEVRDFGKLLKSKAEIALKAVNVMLRTNDVPSEFLKPGFKQCQWCDAKTICPAYANTKGIDAMKKAEEAIDLANEFTPPGVVAPAPKPQVFLPPEAVSYQGLSPDEAYAKAAKVQKEAKLVIDWFTNGLKSKTIQSTTFKLGDMNKGNRKWANGVTADMLSLLTGAKLEDLIEPEQLKTPSALEKQLGKEVLAELEDVSHLIEREKPSQVVKPL
jgi:hypothetical protein